MDAQVDGTSTVVLTQTKALAPGYLLTPFGWAAKPLAAIIQSDPALLRHIFELDRPRMHVIALALAHLDDNPTPHLAAVLFRGSAREVLQRVAGQYGDGLAKNFVAGRTAAAQIIVIQRWKVVVD